MLTQLENFYEQQEEPVKGCLLALRSIFLGMDEEMKEQWKFGGPFFYYKNKMTAYLWIDKKSKEPYIGVVYGNFIDHPSLIKGNRKRIKAMPIDPNKDIPIDELHEIFSKSFIIVDEILKHKLSVYSQKDKAAEHIKRILQE